MLRLKARAVLQCSQADDVSIHLLLKLKKTLVKDIVFSEGFQYTYVKVKGQ